MDWAITFAVEFHACVPASPNALIVDALHPCSRESRQALYAPESISIYTNGSTVIPANPRFALPAGMTVLKSCVDTDTLSGQVFGFWSAVILTATGGQDARAPSH